ncbi:MAG: methyltransferase domain-containing protein [Candidatus Bathyarchaeia archaeon]|jgi:trans-aconitate methyltransferase
MSFKTKPEKETKGTHIKDFSDIAKDYEKISLVQKSAAEILFAIININKNEDALDLGCGTGNLTKRIRDITSGKIEGIDSAENMIAQAKNNYEKFKIQFKVLKAEDIKYAHEFDVIFCNSAFQWVTDPEKVIKNCYMALRKGGRIGIQAPATNEYSPTFIRAVESVKQNSETKETFLHFKSPWFFMENASEYKELFENAGFTVALSEINTVESKHTPEEAFKIFSSGAAVGYLNEDCYSVDLDERYVSSFNKLVKEYFASQIDKDGLVEVIFNRIFLIAIK